jgi:hypothetical protein
VLLANVNRAEKTVAVEKELVYRRRQFPEALAVRSLSGKKCFSCEGEVFALDRCLLMGDPIPIKVPQRNNDSTNCGRRCVGKSQKPVLRTFNLHILLGKSYAVGDFGVRQRLFEQKFYSDVQFGCGTQ